MPKYKMIDDGKGIAVDDKGLPIVVDDSGNEQGIDAIYLAFSKVPELNAEAKKHRLTAKELSEKLAPFEGIEDPDAAKKALETVANLDAKKLVDAGEAERFRAQAIEETKKAYERQLEEASKTTESLRGQVYKLMVSDRFKSSNVAESTILPPDILESYFGRNFKVEEQDGKMLVVGYMGDNQIFSKERPGEIASFDEALETIIDQYPMKDRILKSTAGHGSGATGSGGGAGGKTLSRQAFEAKSPQERMEFVKGGGKIMD